MTKKVDVIGEFICDSVTYTGNSKIFVHGDVLKIGLVHWLQTMKNKQKTNKQRKASRCCNQQYKGKCKKEI